MDRAFQDAEKAFFNPAMLAMLYFPEDHKFAIYVPLFLPVGYPIIYGILKELSRYRRKRKEFNQADAEKDENKEKKD